MRCHKNRYTVTGTSVRFLVVCSLGGLICFGKQQGDIATEIKELNAGINVNGRNVGILLYADDMALVATSEIKLQSMLNILYGWSVKR